MSLDWMSVDSLLEDAFMSWRRARSMARGHGAQAQDDPCAVALARAPSAAELDAFADPLAYALAAWRRRLELESALWTEQQAVWHAWQTPHRCGQGGERSLLQARDAFLAARGEGSRRNLAASFVEVGARLGELPLDLLQRRFGAHCGGRQVAGLDVGNVDAIASALLERTADAATESMRCGWAAGSIASLGRSADLGWPARLTGRWLGEVLALGGLADGLRPAAIAMPSVLGATSFARALGAQAAALVAAARPRSVPWVLHRLPDGSRHQARAALFATLTATVPFARQVLGLGHERALRQRRAMTAAMLASVRIDALRVLLGSALVEGKSVLRGRYLELSEEMFAEPLPLQLLGVLPQLGPEDAPRLLGDLVALEQHQQLTERHDVDWFRNPRAGAELRDQDAHAEQPLAMSAVEQLQLVEGLARYAEGVLS